jgi:hypothetical protein
LTRLTEADLADVLREEAPRGPCPTADALASLLTGDIDSSARLAIVDHVAACPRCELDVRAAMATREWSGRAAAALDATVAPAPRFVARRSERSASVWMGLAAVLALVAVGAVGWAGWLQRDRAALERDLAAGRAAVDRARTLEAQLTEAARKLDAVEVERRMALNTPIVDLLPADVRSSAAQPPQVRIPPDTPLVTVIVALPIGTAAGTPLAIEIANAAGTSIGRWSGLRVSAMGTCTFTVASSALGTGTLRFRVTRDDATARPVHEYTLEVLR